MLSSVSILLVPRLCVMLANGVLIGVCGSRSGEEREEREDRPALSLSPGTPPIFPPLVSPAGRSEHRRSAGGGLAGLAVAGLHQVSCDLAREWLLAPRSSLYQPASQSDLENIIPHQLFVISHHSPSQSQSQGQGQTSPTLISIEVGCL